MRVPARRPAGLWLAERPCAGILGITEPEVQAAWARAQLQGKLESHEMNAVFAAVKVEMKGARGPVS